MFSVAPTNVAAPLVPVVVSVNVFCFVFSAVYTPPDEIGNNSPDVGVGLIPGTTKPLPSNVK